MIDPLGELHARAEEAYAEARRLVYDVFASPINFENLTGPQRKALDNLKQAEADLQQYREAAHRSRRVVQLPSDRPASLDITDPASVRDSEPR